MLHQALKDTTWTLKTYQSQDKEGNINYPLGKDAKGVISFTSTGIFAVQLMATSRPQKLSAEQLERMNSQVEKQMAEYGYHAYTGPFTVDEKQGILTTEVKLSLITDYIGSRQNRTVKIDGDELHLSNIDHPERKLIWEKV